MSKESSPEFGELLAPLPSASNAEQFETLLERAGIRILRVVSDGQASPPGEWFDQDDDEWVVVLAGRAGLLVEGEAETRTLVPGAYAFLPAHCRHRVEWTDPDAPTVWLAIHMTPAAVERSIRNL